MKLLRLMLPAALALFTAASGCATAPDEAAGTNEGQLKTKDHRNISREACEAQSLPAAFCARVGSEAFNVDAREWSNLTAHGQPMAGQSQCTAATAVAARLSTLGTAIHTALATRSAEQAGAIAAALGGALHTVEDNCAHHGMSNPQHAWYSRESECHTDIDPIIFGDPDEQPEALACAATEAAAILASFVEAARAAGYPLAALGRVSSIGETNPSLHQACEFIHEAPSWDGVDTTWNNAATVPAFRGVLNDALVRGVRSTNVCNNLRNPEPFPEKGPPPGPSCFVCGG